MAKKYTSQFTGPEIDAILSESKEKYGYINIRYNEANTTYYIECFANENDFKLFDSDKERYEYLRLQNVQIPISTVEGDAYTALLGTSISNTAKIVVAKDTFIVPLNFRGVKIGKLGNENAGARGTLIVESSFDNGNTYSETGRLEGVLPSEEYEDKAKYTEVDLFPFLADGKQQIRVKATYSYQDEEGKTRNATSANVVIGESVTRTELRLDFTYNYEQPIQADSNTKFPLNQFYTVYGSVEKTLHIKIKGSNGSEELTYNLSSDVTNTKPTLANLEENESVGYLTHGVKRLEAWMTCQDGLGNEVKSNVLVNRVLVVNSKTQGADMTKPYLLLQNVKSEVSNYVQEELCDYAVYIPKQKDDGSITNEGDPINIAFLLTDYTEDYETIKPEEYFRVELEVAPNTQYSLTATVEIEAKEGEIAPDSYSSYFRVRRITDDGSVDFMEASTGEEFYAVTVDNRTSATPVSGATFLLDPKVRNNTESNPARILNARSNNEEVASEWSGFGFVNDGWITDEDGNKALRVPAGAKIKIGLNPFAQFMKEPNSSMTFEVVFTVRNVTNETDPVIDITDATPSGGFRGLRMNALDGWLMALSSSDKKDCFFAWKEGMRTHLSLNINHQVRPNKGDCQYKDDDANKSNGYLPLARLLLNGDIPREIPFKTDDKNEWCATENNQIIIGNEGADIDIYSIRFYENQGIEMTDLLTRNYVASQPTAESKKAIRERNDLLAEGRISLERAKARGLNCLLWHGETPYIYNQSEFTGWYEVFRYDQDGNLMPEYSGTICKETKSLKNKGQGSTAKTYYDWNIQDDQSKVKDKIWVSIEDLHESISVSIVGDKAYIKGGNLGKGFPLATEESVSYDYANGKVYVPDGWIDGNGKYRGMGYMVSPGTSLAQKKVLKINYASSMQSHLYGACTSFDILHRAVVGDTPLQKKVPTAVTAKHTEPFMFFQQQEGSSNVIFRGMGNFGAGKADKVTWGYYKKEHPMFAIIEGSDNNLPMTGFRVPFDRVTAVYSTEDEGWFYNGVQNWDFDEGETTDNLNFGYTVIGDKMPTEAITKKWADICNFVYLHAPHVKYYAGTFTDFKKSDKAKDIDAKYFCTAGDEAYQLKRYCYLTDEWINAGLLNEDTETYKVIDLRTDVMTKAAYRRAESEGKLSDYAYLARSFNEAITTHGKTYINLFFNEASLRFNYAFVLAFLTGSDNSDKNTYYEIMPYTTPKTEDTAFNTWWKAQTGNDFDFNGVYEVFMNGDDMDSIFRTDNNSHQTKPYYIDRLHPYDDENPDKALYEGRANALFNWCEAAYEETEELSSTMNSIFNAMCTLVNEKDKFYGDIAQNAKSSVWGFLHKYFFNVQYYFPEIAYMEQARIRYEFPQLLGFVSTGKGNRAIHPITQSLGSQIANETQYLERRLIYFASYAKFGNFGTSGNIGLSDSADSIGWMPESLPNGNRADYKVKVRPHQYLYPSAATGQTSVYSNARLSPRDEYEFVIATQQASSDNGITLNCVNYYAEIGNFGDISVSRPFKITGKRLIKFEANPTEKYNGKAAFRPSSITIDPKATQLKSLSLEGCDGIGEVLDARILTRCTSINTVGTQIYEVKLPASEVLAEVKLGANTQTCVIDDVPKLNTFTLEGYTKLKQLEIGENVGTLNTYTIVTNIYNSADKALETLKLRNVDWIGDKKIDAKILMWLTNDVTYASITGKVEVIEPDSTFQSNITFANKLALIRKWGNVDDASSGEHKGLIVKYNPIALGSVNITGDYYYSDTPTGDYPFVAVPNSVYANDFSSLKWYALRINGGVGDSTLSFTMNSDTGVLTVDKVPTLEYVKDNVEIYVVVGKKNGNITNLKTIRIYNRGAKVGDLVYYDGSYGPVDRHDGRKSVIGRCFYIAPTDENYANPNDKWKRMMVACNDITINGSTSVQWGIYPLEGDDANKLKNSLFYIDNSDTKQNLTISNNIIADIADITKITSSGMSDAYITDSDVFGTDDASLANGGFVVYKQNTAMGDGFGSDATDRTLDTNLTNLAGDGYQTGDIVNSCYAKTLKIIKHRNMVINEALSNGLNGLTGWDGYIGIPTANQGASELKSLEYWIGKTREWAKNVHNEAEANQAKWSQLLYPAASACYAYEPTVKNNETLPERFKAHNWALPTQGILARLFAYTYDGKGSNTSATLKDNSPLDTVSDSTNSIVFNRIKASVLWSVTEHNRAYNWLVYFNYGLTTSTYKSSASVVRAVSAF